MTNYQEWCLRVKERTEQVQAKLALQRIGADVELDLAKTEEVHRAWMETPEGYAHYKARADREMRAELEFLRAEGRFLTWLAAAGKTTAKELPT